jgi:predicted ester cyclase
MLFFRFEHGRMVEVWELLDRSDLRRQLLGG